MHDQKAQKAQNAQKEQTIKMIKIIEMISNLNFKMIKKTSIEFLQGHPTVALLSDDVYDYGEFARLLLRLGEESSSRHAASSFYASSSHEHTTHTCRSSLPSYWG